jgi:predicted RNase H-like nuclease
MVWDVEKGEIGPEIHVSLADLLAAHMHADAIGIDIPIGLSETGTRRCDVDARKLLGPGRASSVFPPPPYAVLDAVTHAEAVALSKEAIGKGVPIQAFSIFGKIKEANDTIVPEIQNWAFEIHPEVCFWALAGRPMTFPKRKLAGYEERHALLEQATGVGLPSRTEASRWAPPAKPDDILDAMVAAWTAKRVAEGLAGRLPGDVEIGAHGLRMEMVY